MKLLLKAMLRCWRYVVEEKSVMKHFSFAQNGIYFFAFSLILLLINQLNKYRSKKRFDFERILMI